MLPGRPLVDKAPAGTQNYTCCIFLFIILSHIYKCTNITKQKYLNRIWKIEQDNIALSNSYQTVWVWTYFSMNLKYNWVDGWMDYSPLNWLPWVAASFLPEEGESITWKSTSNTLERESESIVDVVLVVTLAIRSEFSCLIFQWFHEKNCIYMWRVRQLNKFTWKLRVREQVGLWI